MLMTSTFDVLSEAPFHTEEYGEGIDKLQSPRLQAILTHPPSDAPINVGWGSKQTQFHGSLGKAAAQAATNLDNVGSSPMTTKYPNQLAGRRGIFRGLRLIQQKSSERSEEADSEGVQPRCRLAIYV
jgi:hypothetical protein